MATIQDAIKRLTYTFTSTGADKVADDLNKVGAAQANVAATAQSTSQASLSLENSFEKLESRYKTTFDAQQKYAAVQKTVNDAVAQNPALQDRANEVLANAATKFDAARGSAGAFNAILDAGRGAALGYAAGIGPIGAVLGSFGPYGIAAAAAIGLVVNALDFMNQKANEIGTESSGLKQFSETTGLSVTQVRGLTEAGAELGIASDTVSSSIQKFTFSLDEARKGGGTLYDQVQAIDAGLAQQLASTRSGSEALDILTRAYNSTADATTKAAIARAAFGRSGASFGAVLNVVGDAGGVDAYSTAVQKALGVTDEWTGKVAALRNENRSLESDLKLIEASIFSEAALDRQNRFLKTQIEIAKAVKDFAEGKSNVAPESLTATATGGVGFGGELAGALGPQGSTSTAPASEANTTALQAETKATEDLTAARRESASAEALAAAQSGNLVSLLGGAATGAEIAEARFHKLSAAFLENKFGASDTAEAIDKYNRALHGDTDNTIAALQDQRAVIEAIGGAAKQAAQYAADYAAAWRAGKDPIDAAAIASEKLANAQAQVNAAAQTTLRSLQDQLPVVSAITGQEQITAQASLTLNNLLRDGVNQETAMAVAAQQMTNATAAASAAVLKQVESLKDQNDMIKAQATGTEASTAAAIAYKNAIASGADETSALALKTETAYGYTIKAQQAALAWQQALFGVGQAAQGVVDAIAAADVAQQNAAEMARNNLLGGTFNADPANTTHEGNSVETIPASFKALLMADAAKLPPTLADATNKAIASGGINAAIAAAQGAKAGTTTYNAAFGLENFLGYQQGQMGLSKSTTTSESDIINLVQQLYQAKNAQTTDKNQQAANLQQELAWLKTQPQTLETVNAITSLQSSIDSLVNSTNSLNSTNQDLLSPFYSQDPRTSHIGFRSQGMSNSGLVDNGLGFTNDNPVAGTPTGGFIQSDFGMAGPTPTAAAQPTRGNVTLNAPITINVASGTDTNAIGRTVYQTVQTAVRTLQAAR